MREKLSGWDCGEDLKALGFSACIGICRKRNVECFNEIIVDKDTEGLVFVGLCFGSEVEIDNENVEGN